MVQSVSSLYTQTLGLSYIEQHMNSDFSLLENKVGIQGSSMIKQINMASNESQMM